MRDPSLSRTEGQRLAHRLERPCFVRREHAQGHTLCPCLCCRKQDFDATHREGECSDPRALHEGATHDVVHGFLPRAVRTTAPCAPAEAAGATTCRGNKKAGTAPAFFGTVRKVNADFAPESSGLTPCLGERRRGVATRVRQTTAPSPRAMRPPE